MKQLAHELANEIFMSTSHVTHLVVEGSSDFSVFRQLIIDPGGINVLPANGSPIVLECQSVVENVKKNNPYYSKHNIHFFIDRDYRILFKTAIASDSLTTTELRDLECQMINSSAFEVICREVICSKRLTIEKMEITDFRRKLVKSATIIGAMRVASEREKSGIDFKELNPSKFFDGKSITLDFSKFAAHLAGKNKSSKITADCISKNVKLAEEEEYFSSPYLLCSGHDIVLLMSAALKTWWKPKTYCAGIDPPTLEALLRVAYKEIFRSTASYIKVYNWLVKITGKDNILLSPI